MKHFMLNKLTIILALFSIVGGGNAWAQLTELTVGGVYHFTNVGYPAKAMVATTPSSIAGVTADNTNKAQLWYVADEQVKGGVTYYALRSLGYGTYLQGNGQSSAWTLANTTDSDKSWFALTLANGNTAIRSYNERNNDHGYAHIDGSSNVVGWSTGAQATQWNISKIEKSSADIQTALGIFGNVASYQTALDALFSDKACTTLRGDFNENDASYKALPTTLQNMVRKVAGGDAAWEEANKDNTKQSWGADYAKKYRVQLYEPYNDAGAAASALGLNAHNSLNNPTGIFANNGDVLYVMVDGEIEEGASLYLAYYIGHGKLDASSKVGYELKQGLNVIPVYQNSSNFCVNYVVQTFDTSDGNKGNKAKARKLSDYDPIKIHIEGGYINGYYNKVGDALYPADKNANWDYIEARATQTDVTVLGKYVTLQFPLKDEDTYDGDNNKNKGIASYFNELVKIEDCIDEWDNVMLWERLLLGVLGESTIQAEAKTSPYAIDNTKKVFEYTGRDGEFESDYSDYYNIHGLSLGTPTGYMYGGWDHCGYHYNTMQSILVNMTTESGPHWGPGHEIGHQHQNLLTVNGLTEVTNNLFSNVVLWYFGKTTSRYNGDNGALSNVLAQFNAEGTDFFSNNIWAQTIMYYKLFLYYHVLGHNPKFYPRLFEMLRQDPMSGGYNQDGSKCLMHFYKKCCLAAGEDLTEFFRAHGFFEVMNNRLVGDYSNSVYTLTQAQIDAAIKDVKDLKYEENLAVLFITDATGEPILSHRDDVEYLEKYGETTICAEVGSYSTFNNNTPANYTYNISGTTMTMEGTGGVGFAILNEKGELIGFSDKKTFELSPEAADAIVSGKASIVTVQADNTRVDAVNIMDSGDDDTRHQLLGNLLDDAKVALDCSDDTGKKVGFYRASALEDLQKAYDTAKGVYDAKTASAYSAVYDVLFQEYTNLINNEYARIEIIDGAAYRLTNKAYSTLNMGVATSGDDENEMFGLTADESSNAQIWYFEPGTTAGTYYLKNKSTSLYPASAGWGAVLKADKQESTKGEKGGAAPYTLHDMGNGVFALNNGYGLHCSKSQSNNIVGWSIDSEATQWYITAVEVDNALEARLKLEETIDKTVELINEMADAVAIQKFKLQNDDPATPFYISTNACYNTLSGETDGQGLSGLLDEETSTYFHSDYSGNAKGTHYLQVDLGESHNVGQFKFNYTTRDNGKNCPTAILVEGSADGTTFNQLATYTAADDALPNGNALSWESPVISNSNNYRYLRFSVTATENSKAYFVMSTFGITNPTPLVTEIKDDFVGNDASNEELKTQIVNALTELAEAQQLVDGAKVTADEYNEQNSDLNTHYNNLLTVYNKVKEAEFNAKKTELQTLINKTTALIAECGEVNYTPATFVDKAPLQVTDANGKFYVSTNAQYASEGNISGLIDGILEGSNKSGYFHSDYSGSDSNDGLDHYIQVNLGESVKLFKFTYTNRHDTDGNYATKMTIWGSTDGTTFEEITRIEGLPASKRAVYTSEEINATKEYTYLRFMVTESTSAKKGGHYFFHMAEFDLIIGKPESYTAQLNQNIGEVTDDLLIAAYKENEEANSTFKYATTELQVIKAIADLQAQYDALEEAKGKVYRQNLEAEIAKTNKLLADCADIVDGNVTTVMDAAGDATRTLILATYNKVVEAQELLNAGNATQSQYEEATTALEAQRTMLFAETQKTTKTTLRTKVGELEALINNCGRIEDGVVVEVYDGKGDVSKSLLLTAYQAMVNANNALAASELSDYSSLTTGIGEQCRILETAKTGETKTTLRAKVGELQLLIDACGTIEFIEEQYVVTLKEPDAGDVTKEQLLTAYQAMENANNALAASELSDYSSLTEGIEDQCEILENAKAGEVKSTLRKLTVDVTTLITLCNETPGDVSRNMLDELDAANDAARDLLQTDNLAAIAEKTTSLQTLYNTVSDTQKSNTKKPLNDLIESMERLIGECTNNEGYVGDVTADLLKTSTQAKDDAQAVVNANNTTTADFTAATATLQGYYNTLLAAKNSTAKADLRAMIAQLAELIEKCSVTGKNIVTTPVPCELQTSPGADFYISTNATDSEGEIQNLVDGDTNTFFQTKSSVGVEHYLLVDAGENNKLKKFKFSYRPCKSPFPYTIVVDGSNDNSTFTELGTFTDLPTTDDQNWESSEIGNGTAYRYLRFNITKSGVAIKVDDNKELDTSVGEQLSNKYKSTLSAEAPQVEYCFAMSEFDITNIVEEEEDIDILAGTVTAEQLDVATSANTAAEALANTSAVKADLEAKTEELQTLYDALYAAYGLKVTLTLTDATRDKLLTGIDLGRQTIGTFSARYATLIPDGVTAYYATQQYNSGGIVWLTRVETTVLPANQGVILIGEETLVDFYPAAEEPQEDLSQNIFSNTASGPVQMEKGDYILARGGQGIGIYAATPYSEDPTSILKQGKAFIRLGAAAATQKLVLRFGGTTTDVDNVPTVILPEDTIYDLSGRRVNEVTKGGVYIVNGKKVFIK